MTQAESILLSLLGPRPVFWKNSQFPDICATWNGMCMTQNHAMMLAGELFWHQSPTPEMRFAADRRLITVYHSGIFENSESWAQVIREHAPYGGMHQWYRRKLKPFIDRNLAGSRPQEVFAWFNLAEWARE